ncbi:TPA: Leucine-rich repeat-containing protein 56 [Trebouxia sp. C0004]
MEMQELLAKEQQEEQLLRDITGVQRLEDVTFLDAVVDCTETSLSSLGEKMPLLRELKLNNSALNSVRDLGSRLRHLQVLWVPHCGLTGLDGLNALPSLKELYAAFNQIENLEPVAGKHDIFN